MLPVVVDEELAEVEGNVTLVYMMVQVRAVVGLVMVGEGGCVADAELVKSFWWMAGV